jgi:hypothetical protein
MSIARLARAAAPWVVIAILLTGGVLLLRAGVDTHSSGRSSDGRGAPGWATVPRLEESAVLAAEEGWAVAADRHYSCYRLLPGLERGEVPWALALIVSGHYEGMFEPCGCTADQAGGHAWELPLHGLIRSSWSHRVVSVCCGGNLVDHSPSSGPMTSVVARASAEYLLWFLGSSRFDYICMDGREAGLLNQGDESRTRTLAPGRASLCATIPLADNRDGIPVYLMAWDGLHRSRVDIPAERPGGVLVLLAPEPALREAG